MCSFLLFEFTPFYGHNSVEWLLVENQRDIDFLLEIFYNRQTQNVK